MPERASSPPEKLTETLTLERRYTTKDFTALRAYVQRIPPAVIARTYYDPDEDAHAATPGAMERHLTAMLDALVTLALAHGSTALADHLCASIRQHGRPLLTAVTFRMVTDAAQLAALPPQADHPIGAWLRPRVARRLKGEGLATLGDLVAFCPARRQLVALDSAHRTGPGPRDRQLVTKAAGHASIDGRSGRRLRRASGRAAGRGRTGRGQAGDEGDRKRPEQRFKRGPEF